MASPEDPWTRSPRTPRSGVVVDDVLRRRIGAGLLDILILALIFFAVGLAAASGRSGSGQGPTLSSTQSAVFALIVLAYYFLSEVTSGQTLGKRMTGVRVVRAEDGGHPTTGAIAIRTVLRLIDEIPMFYLLGFVVVLSTGQRRGRLGDLAAGTAVVRARP
jgi:uncharacterized RDD family membrane protein YckC